MSTIAEPIRVNSFDELKPGEKIWSINRNGSFEILEFVKTIGESFENYAIFLNINKDGIPKFYKGRLKEETWYKYEDNETTWYHIYSAQAIFYETEANYYKERAKRKKNVIERNEEE